MELRPTISYSIRQIAAVSCAATLAWDYCRSPEVLGMFSIWTLILHFIYFQLPMKSRALSYFHSASFIGSNVTPISYLYLLSWKPTFEMDHVEQWDMTFESVLVRSTLVHFAPLIFHALDITVNQTNLIASYSSKPRKLMCLWSLFSFAIFGFVFEFSFPESEELIALHGIPSKTFLWYSKLISLAAALFAFFVLHMLILRRAYRKQKLRAS